MLNSKPYICLLLALLLTACGADRLPDSPASDDTLMLRLQIRMADDSTRGNPTGGENGDGAEDPFENEAKINSLCLVFFNSADDEAINSNAEVKIKYVLSLPDVSLYRNVGNTYLIPLKGYNPKENDRIFAYANASPKGIKVGDDISILRNLTPDATWMGETVKDAANFTMATARTVHNGKANGKITIADNVSGTENVGEYYIGATVTLERTAARIDFLFPACFLGGDGNLIYDLKVPNGDKVQITHIFPVNVMQSPSYFFKHVTPGLDGASALEYCHSEILSEGGVPGNYVVEPATKTKMPGSEGYLPEEWYGSSAGIFSDGFEFPETSGIKSLLENGVVASATENGELNENGSWKSLILSYANENTMTGNDFSTSSRHLTGLAFRAIYRPAHVYSAVDGSGNPSGEVEGFNHGGQNLFCVQIPSGYDENGGNTYFSSEEAARAFNGLHTGGRILTLKNGVCYYNLWIRHANIENGGGSNNSIPMEYAIVRNNIYRISVTFSGPGSSIIDIENPKNMEDNIFVRKWNLLLQPEIIL